MSENSGYMQSSWIWVRGKGRCAKCSENSASIQYLVISRMHQKPLSKTSASNYFGKFTFETDFEAVRTRSTCERTAFGSRPRPTERIWNVDQYVQWRCWVSQGRFQQVNQRKIGNVWNLKKDESAHRWNQIIGWRIETTLRSLYDELDAPRERDQQSATEVRGSTVYIIWWDDDMEIN